MESNEFIRLKPGDMVTTVHGGIGIVAEKYPHQVKINTWKHLTPADAGHCSVYEMSEIVNKIQP